MALSPGLHLGAFFQKAPPLKTTDPFSLLYKRPGIYKIEHIASGKTYVGSAANLWGRRSGHLSNLRRGNHCNRFLQAAFTKYGSDSFEFSVIELVADKALLIEREQVWIDAYRLVCELYNILPLARSALGVKRPPETGERIAAALRGTKLSAEAIAKRTATRRANGGFVHTAQQTAKRLEKMRGRPCPPETRAKIAATLKGQPINDERRAKIAATLTGRQLSDEHKSRMSDGLKASYARRRGVSS